MKTKSDDDEDDEEEEEAVPEVARVTRRKDGGPSGMKPPPEERMREAEKARRAEKDTTGRKKSNYKYKELEWDQQSGLTPTFDKEGLWKKYTKMNEKERERYFKEVVTTLVRVRKTLTDAATSIQRYTEENRELAKGLAKERARVGMRKQRMAVIADNGYVQKLLEAEEEKKISEGKAVLFSNIKIYDEDAEANMAGLSDVWELLGWDKEKYKKTGSTTLCRR
jgi:hypothetical protein